MNHHAYIIEAGEEEGIRTAAAWAEKELGIQAASNPDFNVLRHGLFSVEDARRVSELAAGAAFRGDTKVMIIAASRAYHEAQNALLKLFEEPPAGVYLFLVLPSLGGLLPTLRSRVQILDHMWDLRGPTCDVGPTRSHIPESAREFLEMTAEKRSAYIKKLTTGSDDEKKRKNREEAIALINGIEAAAYAVRYTKPNMVELLRDIAILRAHLYDRSAPVKMILEHLALVIPRDLG